MNSNDRNINVDVNAIRNGDKAAFRAVIDLYYKEVYWYAKSLGRDDTLAKDLTQETFFTLWKKRDKLSDGVVVKGWLYKSVRNKFLDHVKKYRKETYLLETAFVETLDTVARSENQEILKRKMEIIDMEIQNLPKKCSKVFFLSKKEGLTNIEIADYLGVSLKTVEGHLTKALKILREKLKDKIHVLLMILHSSE
ncbi:RNA polymerase sigma-70 factor [Maribacter sp. PR1]|uniref:RNA polymerase sigma-70 factor n=1 Tax=Maribacter cobaltidurans TaxID=1178778 RepID=A0ABU7ITJ0_9FLAO|nr:MULTISPECIES: RNA polymerase sigma-70 factor [Maribacter]MDC6388909.1 RNA polymerase sigma-70 factor [Maribacter sp. PR1]MEE1976297.1 RNA polymerase sigma-70 factor [Maribacter cobaltidurans]